jgi:restriction endonuclease S subunit
VSASLVRDWIQSVLNRIVGQSNVNGTKRGGFAFPLPPVAEQSAIAEIVESQLPAIDRLDTDIDGESKSVKHLRQSVPVHLHQDPSDEAAEVLLNRTAIHRATRARHAATTKRTRSYRKQRPHAVLALERRKQTANT